MEIILNNTHYSFNELRIKFTSGNYQNLFAGKNNKTLEETLHSVRYKKFSRMIEEQYSSSLKLPLGKFLFELKIKNDKNYLHFLNRYGDLVYCRFLLEEKEMINKKGIYLFVVDGKIKYIGRCRDSFKKRINNGYGNISPKNCYIDGQATNCHLNNLISEQMHKVKFYVLPIEDDKEIERLELSLIQHERPEWNIKNKI